jgi:hypothetical protein
MNRRFWEKYEQQQLQMILKCTKKLTDDRKIIAKSK